MNKHEFLEGLRDALSGDVPPAVVQEQLQYYSGYIQSEIQKGRTEEAVMEELGDPRLIARTIEDTTPGAEDGAYEPYSGRGGSYKQSATGSRSQEREEADSSGRIHVYDLNKWYWKLLGIVFVVGIFWVVITLVSGVLSLVIPMLPAIGLVLLVLWFVRGGRGR